jgi:hypothetical protein
MAPVQSSNTINYIFLILLLCTTKAFAAPDDPPGDDAVVWRHPDFDRHIPDIVAVMPMDNLSLDPDIEKVFNLEISSRIRAKGFRIISDDKVAAVMKELGVQTPGQLSAFSPAKLGEKLCCDAVVIGQIEQSAAIHGVVYDAVVVSCSMGLKDCKTGKMLWSIEQKRTAHRQIQADPINMLINFVSHENASREKRIAWLADEMLKTMPNGKIKIDTDDLLNQAVQIKADEE